jgi:hypothetical protein
VPEKSGTFSALIPEDFNLDVETTGDIFGVNHGDSKLVAMTAILKTMFGSIQVRRLRADTCLLQGQGVQVVSSLEA